MTDQNKLIEDLGTFIKNVKKHLQTKELVMLTKIEEVLVDLEAGLVTISPDVVREALNPIPDEELVDELNWLLHIKMTAETYGEWPWRKYDEKMYKSVRKLLQSRQPEKPKITREEIMAVVAFIAEEFPPKEEDMDMIEGLLIDSGFKVID